MQSIVTKYMPATNTRGARIKAMCERGSITIPYPDELHQGEDAHMSAVRALVARFDSEDVTRYGSADAASWGRMRWEFGELPQSCKWYGVAVPMSHIS